MTTSLTSDTILFPETVDPKDSDFLDYFPLSEGKVPVSSIRTSRLSLLQGGQEKYFQFGPDSRSFLNNKRKVRATLPINEIYKTSLTREQLEPVVKWMEATLLKEYRMTFGSYGGEYWDEFDQVASGIVEDLAIITVDPETGKDYASCLHLSAPSDWNVNWAFGRSFAEIHQKVVRGNGKLVIQNPEGLVKGIIKSPEPVQRVGSVSFRPNNFVNRNLDYCPEDKWTWDENQEAFVRFERQVAVPFPEINSFLLIIRSYYNDLTDPRRLPATLKALDNLSPDVYHKVFLNNQADNLKKFLLQKQTQL